MERQKFEVGDTVAYQIHIAPNVPAKRRLGIVEDIGHQGNSVLVCLNDDGSRLWLKRNQVEIVATRAMQRAERTRNQRAEERTVPKNPTPPAAAVVAAAEKPANDPPSPPPAQGVVVASSIDALVAAGQDPFAIFLAMGQQLVARGRGEVERAEAALRAADANVASAQQLLADAERERAALARTLAETRARLETVERAAAAA